MSNIDQAFINAYSDQQATTSLPQRTSYAIREPGPTLRVFTQAAGRETVVSHFAHPQHQGSTVPMSRSTDKPPAAYIEIVSRQQSDSADVNELTLPSLVGERKPLSTFSAPKPAPTAAFKPVFEVDAFRWPVITDELIQTSQKSFAPVTDLLHALATEGRTLIGISGNARAGVSTITMCLARLLAATGSSVAIVDGNFVQGDLARTLGLEFNHGWGDVLAGNMPLAECAIASLLDKMTLIPLDGPTDSEIERLASIQSSVIAGMLRHHHDLVLFDLGAASDPTQLAATCSIVEHCRLDAGIIVTAIDTGNLTTMDGIDQLNAVFGPLCLGTIGNRAN
jgi:Mrp family chromosome partitioning ATPase